MTSIRKKSARGTTRGRKAEGDRGGARRTAEPVRFGPLPGYLGYQIRQAQAAIFRDLAASTAALNVTPGEYGLLSLVEANPGISQTDLSRANGRDKSSLTPVLNNLVRRKLVHRRRTARDRRTYRLTLTPAGEAMLSELAECAKAHEAALDKVIGRRDRAKFLTILRKLMTELE